MDRGKIIKRISVRHKTRKLLSYNATRREEHGLVEVAHRRLGPWRNAINAAGLVEGKCEIDKSVDMISAL